MSEPMSWTILGLTVLTGTAFWPLGRWALKADGKPVVVGFWVSLTVALICAAGTALTGDWRGAPVGVGVAGALMGVAYAVGFWICVMRALQIGPAGPTATVNNMAMAAGVLYGLLFLTPGRGTALTWCGLAGVCAALVLLGLGKPAENGVHRTTGARWARLVAIGGAFSGLSFVIQAHVGTLYSGHKWAFGAVGFGLSALLLLPSMLRQTTRFRFRQECLGGVGLGLATGAGMPLSMVTIQKLGADVVLPVTAATPILLVLVIGRAYYKEHLTPAVAMGCVLGALSVAAMAYGGASRSPAPRTVEIAIQAAVPPAQIKTHTN